MGHLLDFVYKRWHRWLEGKVRTQVLFLLVAAVVLWLAGLLAAHSMNIKDIADSATSQPAESWWWSLVHVMDTGYLHEHRSAGPRVVGFLLTAMGWILLGGVFISLVTNGFDKHVRRVREGLARYRFRGKHGIILGWDRSGTTTVEHLLNHGCREVAILSLRPAQEIRNQLIADPPNGQPKSMRRVFILHGDFDSKAELERLSPHLADRIVILGDAVVGCDSRNIKAAMHIAEIARGEGVRRDPAPTCYVNIANLCSYDLLQEIDLSPRDRPFVNFRPFNYCEQWARRLWGLLGGTCRGMSQEPFRPLANQGPIGPDEEQNVVVAVIGFGQMGQAVAVQAARLAHYANAGPGRETQILVIDPDLATRKEEFLSHYHLLHGADCEYTLPGVAFEFIEASSMSEKAVRRLSELATCHVEGRKVMTVVVCASDPDQAMAAAMALPTQILMADIPVLVWQETAAGLDGLANRLRDQRSEWIQQDGAKRFDTRWEDIRFFGNLDECILDDANHEELAKRIHEKWLGTLEESIENTKPSQRPWDQLGEKYRWSNRYQADSFRERLLANGFRLVPVDSPEAVHALDVFSKADEELERMAIQEHNRWWVQHVLAGWTVGPRDDLHLKHPSMVPYEELDEKTRDIDRSAMAGMVEYLREVHGYAIVRCSEIAAL